MLWKGPIAISHFRLMLNSATGKYVEGSLGHSGVLAIQALTKRISDSHNKKVGIYAISATF